MTRVSSLVMLIIALLAAPLAAEAQPAGKVPRVGVLTNGSAATSPPVDAFRRGLSDLGRVEGQTSALKTAGALL
jgi:putative tryptophan/tyrosine transport system substrate-binding protein